MVVTRGGKRQSSCLKSMDTPLLRSLSWQALAIRGAAEVVIMVSEVLIGCLPPAPTLLANLLPLFPHSPCTSLPGQPDLSPHCQACSCLRVFALHSSNFRKVLGPDICSVNSFRSLFKCDLLNEDYPDHPMKPCNRCTLPPITLLPCCTFLWLYVLIIFWHINTILNGFFVCWCLPLEECKLQWGRSFCLFAVDVYPKHLEECFISNCSSITICRLLHQSSQAKALFSQVSLGNANSEGCTMYTKNVLSSTKLHVPFLEIAIDMSTH